MYVCKYIFTLTYTYIHTHTNTHTGLTWDDTGVSTHRDDGDHKHGDAHAAEDQADGVEAEGGQRLVKVGEEKDD